MNYIVGLKLSSELTSLWLIYDYNITDGNGKKFIFRGSPSSAPYRDPPSNNSGVSVHDGKFFNGDYDFDVGQICANIDDWDASQGLSSESVNTCLDATHYFNGNPLHFKAEKQPPLESLQGPSRELAPSMGRLSSSKLKLSLGRICHNTLDRLESLRTRRLNIKEPGK